MLEELFLNLAAALPGCLPEHRLLDDLSVFEHRGSAESPLPGLSPGESAGDCRCPLQRQGGGKSLQLVSGNTVYLWASFPGPLTS